MKATVALFFLLLHFSFPAIGRQDEKDKQHDSICQTKLAGAKGLRWWVSPALKELVAARMQSEKISHLEVGDALGVSRRYVGKILHQPRIRLSEDQLMRLARFLQITESPELKETRAYTPPEWDYDHLPGKIFVNAAFMKLAEAHRKTLHLTHQDIANQLQVSCSFIRRFFSRGQFSLNGMRTVFFLKLIEVLKIERESARLAIQDPSFDIGKSLSDARESLSPYNFERQRRSLSAVDTSSEIKYFPERITVTNAFGNQILDVIGQKKIPISRLIEALNISKTKFYSLKNPSTELKSRTFLQLCHLLQISPIKYLEIAYAGWAPRQNLPERIPATVELVAYLDGKRTEEGYDIKKLAGEAGVPYRSLWDIFNGGILSFPRDAFLTILEILHVDMHLGVALAQSPRICEPALRRNTCTRSFLTAGHYSIPVVTYAPHARNQFEHDMTLLVEMKQNRPGAVSWAYNQFLERLFAVVIPQLRGRLPVSDRERRLEIALHSVVSSFPWSERSRRSMMSKIHHLVDKVATEVALLSGQNVSEKLEEIQANLTP